NGPHNQFRFFEVDATMAALFCDDEFGATSLPSRLISSATIRWVYGGHQGTATPLPRETVSLRPVIRAARIDPQLCRLPCGSANPQLAGQLPSICWSKAVNS